jgi:LPXTG-motif cell wall-anchored protein
MDPLAPHIGRPRPQTIVAALAALLTALVLGISSPAVAGSPGNGGGTGGSSTNAAQNTKTDTSQNRSTHSTAPDHSQGNASTTGSAKDPQPLSTADQKGGGANGQCPGAAYCSTRDGSASQNGRGDTTGNAQAKGKPCAGCVGKADNKNPRGQRPNGSDHNAGYECDRNQGIGQSNPAHPGCAGATGSSSGSTPSTGGPSANNPADDSTTAPNCPLPMTGTTTGNCGTTAPPLCPGPMTGPLSGVAAGGCAGIVTSPPFLHTVGASGGLTPFANVAISAPVTHPATQPGMTSATGARAAAAPDTHAAAAVSTGVLPNTGAPANAPLILLGALAMLACGVWVVRRRPV